MAHAKKDEGRDVDLGPEHDWSSHAADAFSLMAVAYKEPSRSAHFKGTYGNHARFRQK
jgi:phage terminase large subunit